MKILLFQMSWLKKAAPLACAGVLMFFLAGCLISEREEYTLRLNPDGKTGTLFSLKSNVQSGSADTADQRKDFAELISNWKSDQYLIDRMTSGVYIKDRDVRLDGGEVVWSETSLVSDASKILPRYNDNDTTRLPLNLSDGEVTETNGTMNNMKDSVVIVWPPHTREFIVKMKVRDFHPKSDFGERLKEYLKQNGG